MWRYITPRLMDKVECSVLELIHALFQYRDQNQNFYALTPAGTPV